MSTLQSAHQYGETSWPLEIREKSPSVEAQRAQGWKAKKKSKRKKHIAQKCHNCGREYFVVQRGGKFCSHECYAAKASRNKNFVQCMKCLQTLGFGIKAIGRQTALSHVIVRATMLRAGVYSPQANNKAAANRLIMSSKTPGRSCSGYAVSRARTQSSAPRPKSAIQKTRRMLRNQIARTLEMMRANRQFKTEQYVGCSFDEARRAIESKFELGMSWDNYGTAWELDHIVPMSSFDLSNPDQAMKVNHISNLQPMHPHFNRSKGNKIFKKRKKVFQKISGFHFNPKPAGAITHSLLL
jgi:hypothetical protein